MGRVCPPVRLSIVVMTNLVSMAGKGRRLLSGRRDGEVEASGKQKCVRGNVRFHADADVTEGRRREMYK